jgi:hypothetical protein
MYRARIRVALSGERRDKPLVLPLLGSHAAKLEQVSGEPGCSPSRPRRPGTGQRALALRPGVLDVASDGESGAAGQPASRLCQPGAARRPALGDDPRSADGHGDLRAADGILHGKVPLLGANRTFD